MRIRRSASRLLDGAAAAFAPAPAPSDAPRFELSPPPPPPPATDIAQESSAGLVAPDPEASSCGEPCCDLNQSPWDLMDQLDLSDPEVEELFEKTYFRKTTRRASWLFPSTFSMPSDPIKEKTIVDIVDGAINMAAKPMEGKKNESKSKTYGIKVKKRVRTYKKRDGKKPQRKRPADDMGEAFYYYDGFGPSRSTKRHCRSSGGSSVLEEPPLPIEQHKDEACPQTQFDFSAGQANVINHQVVPTSTQVGELRLSGSNANIVSCVEESSDVDALGCYGKQLRDITMMKSPFKKRWRKPVKARSLKSLM